MEMTQRGQLSDEDKRTIDEWDELASAAQQVLGEWRRVMVGMVSRSSYREVSRLTGISTTTLQRWTREAGK